MGTSFICCRPVQCVAQREVSLSMAELHMFTEWIFTRGTSILPIMPNLSYSPLWRQQKDQLDPPPLWNAVQLPWLISVCSYCTPYAVGSDESSKHLLMKTLDELLILILSGVPCLDDSIEHFSRASWISSFTLFVLGLVVSLLLIFCCYLRMIHSLHLSK